jgi:DNA-binding NtrC family response regulator
MAAAAGNPQLSRPEARGFSFGSGMKIATRRHMNCRQDDTGVGAVTNIPTESARAPQVLVVDDSKVIREIVVWLLHLSGYRALAAENGFAAQLLLQAEHPTLIITDLNMPLGDGWDLLTFCHKHCPEVPVMIISGEGLGKHPEIERWAASFLAKPFDSRKFRVAVDQLISQAA